MALSLNRRAGLLVQTDIRVVSIECEKAGGVNLAKGVCDTEVPPEVRRGAQRAVDEGFNSYTRYDGLPEIRNLVARKLKEYNGLAADPEGEIVVSAGSTGAFYAACLALLNPGDEVLLFEPYYGYHVNTVLAVDAVPGYVPMRPPDWTFSPDDLERAATPRTRAIMINTPANPSGKVFSRKELEWIRDFAVRRDLFVFTDEIYEYILYDGREHVSPATLPGMQERTITISGYSKTFSITGWRIGYAVGDRRWMTMIGYMNDLVYVCAPAPLQIGVARGIAELGPEYYRSACADYAKKRDRICGALRKAGLTPHVPQGAYYVLADVSRLEGRTSKERAMELLRRAGVASVPGEAFYHRPEDGAGLARFCYAKTPEALEEACRRIERLA